MKLLKLRSEILYLCAAAMVVVFASHSQAANVTNLTGYWQDDHGNFIEVQRNGPNAIALMQSQQGRSNWTRGTMNLSGKQILLAKKRDTRTVGQVKGEFVNQLGAPRIRWSSGRVWKKSSTRAYTDSLRRATPAPAPAPVAAAPVVQAHHLQGRWQSNDKTVIEVIQNGNTLNVRVVSRQSHNHPWTSGHGQISNTQLSMNCYHGTALTERVFGVYVPGSRGEARMTWSNGQTWTRRPDHFRGITDSVVAVGRAPIDAVGTVIPAYATSTWQDRHGAYFHRSNDGRWAEYGRDGEMRHRYREIGRTKLTVTIHDDRRGISVYLQKDECWVKPQGSYDWKKLSEGHWCAGPPNSSGPAVSRHKAYGRGGHQHQSHSRHDHDEDEDEDDHDHDDHDDGRRSGGFFRGFFRN